VDTLMMGCGRLWFFQPVERLAWRELRRAPQAREPSLQPLLRLEIQHLEEERQRGLLVGLDEPGDELAGGGGERELRQPRGDLIAHRGGLGGAAHATARVNSTS
jgi:hypothetical protein